MQRRQLLHVGAGSALALALAAMGLSLVQPVMQRGQLAPSANAVLHAVARAVLDTALPADVHAREGALQAHMQRTASTLAGLPPAVQADMTQLLTVLAHPAGRWLLAGLSSPWHEASTGHLQTALQTLRDSRISLRRQAYHALRDLTVASYFAAPDTWAALGYPGPLQP